MPDDGVLSDLVQVKAASDTIVVYLVVRFPGASFALTSEEDGKSELPATVSEESMMENSRIVLRGTVTIPVPERDMQRVVHRLLNRGAGSETPSLQDLVSSMSYLPRYRLEQDSEAQSRRAAGAYGHRRRRRRRTSRSMGSLAVDLRAHSVRQIGVQLNSLSARSLRPSLHSSALYSWSQYLDLDQEQSVPEALDEEYELNGHDSMFDQDLGLDTSLGSIGANGSFQRMMGCGDVDHLGVGEDEEEAAAAAAAATEEEGPGPALGRDWRYGAAPSTALTASGFAAASYRRGENQLELYRRPGVEEDACSSMQRTTSVALGDGDDGDQGSGSWQQAQGLLGAVGSMVGTKRKHSDMCGQGMLLEHRLTARCRNVPLSDLSNLSINDTVEQERPAEADMYDGAAAAAHPPAVHDGHAADALEAGAAGDVMGMSVGAAARRSAQCAAAGHKDVAAPEDGNGGSGLLQVASSHSRRALDLEEACGVQAAGGLQTDAQPPAGCAPFVPSRSGSETGAALSPRLPSSGSVACVQGAVDAFGSELTVGAAAAVSLARSASCDADAGDRCGCVEYVEEVSGRQQEGARERERERRDKDKTGARVVQDKEGCIQVSCDPLASVPLDELPDSRACSNQPASSAGPRRFSALARSASGSGLGTDCENRSKDRRWDVDNSASRCKDGDEADSAQGSVHVAAANAQQSAPPLEVRGVVACACFAAQPATHKLIL